MTREPNNPDANNPDGGADDLGPESEFARRLDEALDEGRSLDDPQWLEAARDDAGRRELLEGYRALSEGLRQRRARPQARPSADLASRVLAQLRDESSLEKKTLAAPSRTLRFSRTVTWAAYAAAACLVVAPLIYFQMRTIEDVNKVAVKQTPVPEVPKIVHVEKTPDAPPVSPSVAADAPRNDPALRTLVAEAGGRYLALAQETRESFAEVAVLLPSVPARDPQADAKKQWIDQVGDGLKPVTRSVGGAFDFLLQAIPIEEPRS